MMASYRTRIPKLQWFAVFNGIAILLLLGTGRLRMNIESLLACAIGLGVVNLTAFFAARRHTDWK
jgi:hypothetical protein